MIVVTGYSIEVMHAATASHSNLSHRLSSMNAEELEVTFRGHLGDTS